MSRLVFALPVSVEQIAAVIKQMSQTDQQQLLDLVPDLRRIAAWPPSRTVGQAQSTAALSQTEVMTALNNQPLSPDDLFLGDLTLGQYHALSDEEKAELWDKLADVDLVKLEEQEVAPHALSAG